MTKEISELYELVSLGIARLKAAEAEIAKKDVEHELERARVAHQVLHDIKSSLTVIYLESKSSSDLLCKSIERISKILDDAAKQKPQQGEISFVTPILHQVKSEKLLVYPRTKVHLRKGKWHLPFVGVNSSKLFRIFSNLIENSAQADATKVFIDLKVGRPNIVDIFFIDDGHGMSPSVKEMVLTIGGSYDKPGGTGLGLSWALREIASINGSLRIRSAPGKGTVIWVALPRSLTPSWFVGEIRSSNISLRISEENIRSALTKIIPWHFEPQKKRANSSLEVVFTTNERVPGVANILLVETDDIGQINKIFQEWRGPILPVGFMPFVKFNRCENTYVYLDDEDIFLEVWEQRAAKDGIECRVFSSSRDLFEKLESLPKESLFYLDVELKNEKAHGIEVADILFHRGYYNLFLATNHMPSALTVPSYILGVIDKTPPWVLRGPHVEH